MGDAWDLATGSDLSLPEVPGARPVKVRVLNAYVDRVLSAAERDPAVSRAFLRTLGMLDRPRALLRPTVAVRVLGRPRVGAGAAPTATGASGLEPAGQAVTP